MGYAERSYSHRFGNSSGGGGGRLGQLFGSVTPWVRRLLVANGAIWLLMWAGLLPGGFRPDGWTIQTFGFSPAGFLTHPWSPLTYMFVHGGFWHVLVNMVILFFFGPHLERAWGGREFLKFYLVAGLGGALGSVVFLPLPDVHAAAPMVGASAAIFGLMLAFALEWPDTRVYLWFVLPIRAKWFMALLAGFTFFATFSGGGGNVAHWAHLGGLVTGFGYLKWGQGLSRVLDSVFDRVAGLFPDGGGSSGARPTRQGGRGGRKASGHRRLVGGSGGGSASGKSASGRRRRRRSGDADGETTSEEMLDEVDRILDKIREDGLDSLSVEEREFLDEMSRRYRG